MFVMKRQSPPIIRIPPDAPRPVHFAGAELRRYLERILEVSLPVTSESVITLDVCSDPALDEEGYRITIQPAIISILGGGPAGVVYGVYEFLRRFCGCRFANPAPDGEIVPRREELGLPSETIVRNPLIWYRSMQINQKADPQTMIRQIDWMAKIGLNYILTMPVTDYAGNRGVVDIDPETREARPQNAGRYTDAWFAGNILPAIRERGLKICMANHNFRRWIPPELHFAGHPEWYALVNGKRDPATGQLCLCTSNREMRTTLIAGVLHYLRENPEVRMIGVCPEDGYGCCQCEACRKLDVHPDDADKTPGNWRSPEGENPSKSRRFALLVNEVARALRREFPKVWVYYPAYVDLQWPPRDVRLEANVAVMVALYWRCSAHEISPDGCEMNRFYFDLLNQWKQMHNGPLLINEYYYGMKAQRMLPYPMAAMACRNWPIYRALGVGGGKTNTFFSNFAVYGLNFMAFARCGWEEPVGYAAVLDEFLEGMFGQTAVALKPVYDAFDQAVAKIERGQAGQSAYLKAVSPAKGCLLPNGRNIGYFLDEIGLDFINDRVRHAEAMALDERERRQVARFKNAVGYWSRSRAFYDAQAQVQQAEADGAADLAELRDRQDGLGRARREYVEQYMIQDDWGGLDLVDQLKKR